jgi:hypothetical protein
VLAGLVGIVVGTMLAVIRDRTDRVVRKAGQLSSTGLPYLGTVKGSEHSSTESLEDFRRIALECLINSEAPTATRLLVVGADEESNSWLVARGMTDALASYGKKVTLVDVEGNSGAPSGKPGLSDYLAGVAEWSECATPTLPNICEVGAGSDGDNLDAYFLAGRLPEVPLPLRRGEYAVIAGPSIVHTPVAVALTSIADVGLLIATTKSTRLADVEEAKFTLQAMTSPPSGS